MSKNKAEENQDKKQKMSRKVYERELAKQEVELIKLPARGKTKATTHTQTIKI